jgi:hypothetical protein
MTTRPDVAHDPARRGPPDLDRLRDLATQIRRDAVRMIAANASGHVGGALGAAEILAALYGHVHAPRPHRPRPRPLRAQQRPRLRRVLRRPGPRRRLPIEELATFRLIDSRLQGHPARVDLPDLVETSTGPLGQGFSVANGLALAAKLDGRPSQVFCLVGDGEMQEGQVWEALMTAHQHRLANVTLIISGQRPADRRRGRAPSSRCSRSPTPHGVRLARRRARRPRPGGGRRGARGHRARATGPPPSSPRR